MKYKIYANEAKKLINEHIKCLNHYNENFKKYIEKLENSGIDTTPPNQNDEVLPICLNCWFNKSFYASMYLLKHHIISRGYIDTKWGVPTIEVNVRKENMELIKLAGLTSYFRKNETNWPVSWNTNSKYYGTWEYINNNHPRLQVFCEIRKFSCEVTPFVNKDNKIIKELLNKAEAIFEYTIELMEQYGELCSEYRNTAYAAAMKEYSLNKYNNEVLLYFMVRCVFSDAVFQYREDFLDKLSLDIYVPTKKFAIEYQGVFHYSSIPAFGGEEGLCIRKKNDEEKKHICEKEGIILCQWNFETPINDYNVATTLAAFLHMDSVELRKKSRMNLELIGDKGMKGEDILTFVSQLKYVRPKKKTYKKSIIKKQYVFRKYDLAGVFLSQYASIEKASEEVNVKPITITKACKGLQKTAGGYQWRKCEAESVPEPISKVEDCSAHYGARAVYQIDMDGVILKKYESISAASKAVGIDSKNIRSVLNGVQKKAGGFFWEYA